MSAKRGIFVAPFHELADARVLAGLARDAESRGWDGVFLWDHIRYSPPEMDVIDPWIAMAAIALATERVRIGPLVTPLARRRVHKLARETVTLDHLSDGRLVLGVGLGSDNHGELADFGEETDPRERAKVQQPRIPVWVAGRWPNRRPLRRAAQWDGLFPIDLPGPAALAELAAEARELRGPDAGPFDIVAELEGDEDVTPWEEAGATWVLRGFGKRPLEADVRAAIERGP
jgi:hypothetical protein